MAGVAWARGDNLKQRVSIYRFLYQPTYGHLAIIPKTVGNPRESFFSIPWGTIPVY